VRRYQLIISAAGPPTACGSPGISRQVSHAVTAATGTEYLNFARHIDAVDPAVVFHSSDKAAGLKFAVVKP
jgi:hypothetical protein